MNENLIESVSPISVPAQFFVVGPLSSAFISLFPASFTFVISNMLSGSFQPVFIYGLVVFAVSFALLMSYFAAKCYIEPTKTIYRIFPDRIEYEEGLFNKQMRTLMLDQVIDVTEVQGVLQQTVGAGTVGLVTQQLTSSGDGKLSNRTIAIQNIPNSRKVYETLRGLAVDSTPVG